MDLAPDNQLGKGESESARDMPSRDQTPRQWTFPLLLCLILALALLAKFFGPQLEMADVGRRSPEASWTPAPRPDGQAVGLTIDFGNGARRSFDALPWFEGMTVRDAMTAATAFSPAIRFQQQGQDAAALLTSLEGVANEGVGGRNWLYRVDDKHGQVSFAVQTLTRGERVLWTFDRGE